MEEMVTAKDFRLRFKEMCDKVLEGKSFIVLRRSRPVFRVEPLERNSSDLLNKVAAATGQEPSLEEINDIVHKVRREIK
ncbi:hypothetical protein ACFL5V_10120 [Fibrobacterota bacterium]